jgi:hypothetical protein
MGDQYKVDLSELEGTITKLNGVIRQLGQANSSAKYSTYLPHGALGSGFQEAEELAKAHTEMKAHIEEIVDYLHEVMNEFGDKTKTAHDNYSNQDFAVQTSMTGPGSS